VGLIMKRFFSSKPKAVKASLKDYTFLKELGITRTNSGVFHSGQYQKGNGQVVAYRSPTSGEVLASVQLGNDLDYNDCVASMKSDRAKW
jgi:hypothetical protein